MDFVAHYIFFNLYVLVFCLDDLYGIFSETLEMYRNMWYIIIILRKYLKCETLECLNICMVHHFLML
jgi:hypothetical protein